MLTLARTILRKRKGGKRRGGKKKTKKPSAESNLPNIPEEIVLHILSRLPLKSLMQFMCVSKQWLFLIQDYAKNVRQPKVVVCINQSLHSIDEKGCVESICVPWEDKKSLHDFYLEIYGSCNGLLLIRITNYLFLWNPLTQYWKKVMACHHVWKEYHVVSGLCFDSLNNVYKFVLSVTELSRDYGDGNFILVTNLRSQRWKSVKIAYSLNGMTSGPVVNEHLHWFAYKNSSNHFHQIVSFDSRMDEFQEVPMPQPKHGDGDIILGLGALDGCLCMARFDNPSCNVEVLAMKEYGIESSWTAMFIVSHLTRFSPSDQLVPLCSTKNNEVIMKICQGTDKGYIKAYNPNDNSQRDIPFPANHRLINAVMYEESLVTPPAYD